MVYRAVSTILTDIHLSHRLWTIVSGHKWAALSLKLPEGSNASIGSASKRPDEFKCNN